MTSNQEGPMTTDLLRLDDLLHRVDLPLASNDPHTWTIGGEALGGSDLACALSAGQADWQAVGDLNRLDALEVGYDPCPHCRARDEGRS
jgi:hypothetical protein